MGDVEEHELADGAVAHGPRERGARPHRGRRRDRPGGPWAWVVVAVSLAVGGVVAAPPGGVPVGPHTGGVAVGMLELDLRSPPALVWRTELTTRLEGARVLQVLEDTVLTSGPDAVAGHALADGALRWRLEGTELGCHGDAVVVCVDAQGTAEAEIVPIDPLVGEQARTPAPGVLAAVIIDDDVVVLRRSGPATDEHDDGVSEVAELVRLAPDGQERWRADLSVGRPYDGRWQGRLQVDGDRVTADGQAFDAGTGEALPPEEDRSRVDERTEIRLSDDPPSDRFSVDVLVDGEVVARRQGTLLWPDDDLGGLVDIHRPDQSPDTTTTTAVRSDTGEELWSVVFPYRDAVARMEGVVVLSGANPGDRDLVGLDAWTGERAWTAAGASLVGGADDVLLVHDDDGRIGALDARTGQERWMSEVTEFFGTRVDIHGGMVVVTGEDLVRLDWAD